MSKVPLILVGGGGHCRSCIDVIESIEDFEILGILDFPSKLGERVLKYQIIGNDDDVEKFLPVCRSYLVTIGQIEDAQPRVTLFERLQGQKLKLPTIISRRACVSTSARIGEGTIIMHGAVVNVQASIGANAIINTGAIVEHNTRIGSHTHISSGACVNGGCKVGDRVFVGSRAVIRNGVSITDDVIVGAGAVIIRPVTEAGVYVGNPARRLR